MKVTLEIPEYVVTRITSVLKDRYGYVPTEHELHAFFDCDVISLYEDNYDKGKFYLEDSLEAFFGLSVL
jgi:hypothetical protein